MPIWSKLFGQRKPQSLKNSLLTAATGGGSENWEDYDGVVDGFGCRFRYPRDWVRGKQGDYLILQPGYARRVWEGDVPRVTPCMTFYRLRSKTLAGDDFLEGWLENRKSIAGFVMHEAEKLILDGLPALALRHDYSRESGIWSAVMTLRVEGQNGYYFDAAGLKSDVDGREEVFIPVLARLRIG